jgi:glycosyltransferase involved in cell wall biosynthesis
MGWNWQDVCWVVDGGDETPRLASVRYMAMIPANHLGGKLEWYSAKKCTPESFLNRTKPKLLICNKVNDFEVPNMVRVARDRGIKVASVFCDWRFEVPISRTMADISDLLIVQTRAMAEATQDHFGREPFIIEECYEGRRGKVRFKPGRAVKLVWYGHFVNADTIPGMWRQLTAMRGWRFSLHFVTNGSVDQLMAILQNLPPPVADLEISYTQWTEEAQEAAVKAADVVLLPSLDNRFKHVKGHNRLVQAIHAGRLALAYPLAPYQELADYCWVGNDFAEGMAWALDNRSLVIERLHQGQRYIDKRFSPSAVGRRWVEAASILLGPPDD